MTKSPCLQVPFVAESVSDHVAPQKKTKGRQKEEMKKEEVLSHRHVSFSKRKNGLFRKAAKLSLLANAEIAAVVVSESGRVFPKSFGTPSCDVVIDRYLDWRIHNDIAHYQNDNANYNQNNCSVIEPAIVETIPSINMNRSMIVEATPLSSQSPLFGDFEDIINNLNDENVVVVNMIVSTAKPCEYQQEYFISTGGNSGAEEMSADTIEEMIEEMSKPDEVPACSEFVTDLITDLIPSATTSLLFTVDQNELLTDNRGLGTCYFNPYADWSCTPITLLKDEATI